MKNIAEKVQASFARLFEPLRNENLRTLDRILRIASLVLFTLAIALNFLFGIRSLVMGKPLGLVNLAFGLLVAWLAWVSIRSWRAQDSQRARTLAILEELERRHEEYLRDSIPLTAPEDATDPFAYAMMRAFQDDRAFHIERGKDGLWRDKSTGQVIPIQDEVSGPEKGA